MLALLASADPNAAPPFFTLLSLVFMGVIIIALILVRFKQSLMAGYFICGIILANSGLLVHIPDAQSSINALSEVGIILLMFTLGLEFSLDELKHLRKLAITGGGTQMSICTFVFALALYYFVGLDLSHSIVLGCIIGLSSTAVSIKSFQEFGLSGTSGAKMALGIALFQDIAAIMLVAMMPQIFSQSSNSWETTLNISSAIGKGILFLAIAWLIGKYILPRLMHAVSLTKSRELFTLMVFAICSGIAMLATIMGLSIALGAFIAGLVVSSSYYSHRVLSEVLPFKDLFLTVFFVSAGLLIDLGVVADQIWTLTAITAIVLIVKFFACFMAAKALHISGKMGLFATTSLTNVGEFSLVLIPFMRQVTNVPENISTTIYAIAAISMGLTPLFMKLTTKITAKYHQIPGLKSKNERITVESLDNQLSSIHDHAIICGYGPVGRHLHEQLMHYGIPCIIIDLNAETIKNLYKQGHLGILGDIQHQITMELAGVARARMIAYTFPDPNPALASYMQIKSLNPTITVMARAKFRTEAEKLHHIGIKHVIYDEVESGIAAMKVAMRSFDLINMDEQNITPPQSHH